MIITNLITGPMFSGKSKRLAELIETYILRKKKCLYITPKKDVRKNKSHNLFVSSYLKEILKSEYVDNYIIDTQEDLINLIKEKSYKDIFIDEYFMINFDESFFYELETFSNEKNLIMNLFFAGLISDANNKLFPIAIKILPFMSKIEKLTSICMNCGGSGDYSFYMDNDFNPNEINIDKDNYKCLCLNCYKEALTYKKSKIYKKLFLK